MNRRDAMMSTGGMIVSAYLGAVACGSRNAVAHDTNAPQGHGDHAHGDTALADAALECVHKGEACMAHCIALLGSGDTSMAGCAAAVNEMKAVMHSLAVLAAAGSKRTADAARFAMKFCQDCEMECKKHADRHPVCKDCMDACHNTVAACQRAAG
jgi:Cys-rich four helix bundle protein (predicted Tat secretion target)